MVNTNITGESGIFIILILVKFVIFNSGMYLVAVFVSFIFNLHS